MKLLIPFSLRMYAILMLTLLACTEEDITGDLAYTNKAHIESSPYALPTMVNVYPSGDMTGMTDANAIEEALRNASPGATVILKAGKYFVGRPIVTPGFHGILKGEGPDKTRIVGVGSPAAPFSLTTIRGDFGPTDLAVLFHFPDPYGKVIVADLSVSLKKGFFSETIVSGFIGPNDLFAFFVIDIGYDEVNTSFHNVALKGIAVNEGGPFENLLRSQPSQGIVVHGLRDHFPFPISGGDHTISHSRFHQIGLQAIVLQLLDHARLKIHHNQLSEVKQIITRYLNGSRVEIEHNHISSFSFGAVVVTQEFQPSGEDKNQILIRNNTIHTDGFMGIEIGAASNFQVLIAHNHIEVGPDPTGFFSNFTGIGLFSGQDRAILHRNTIRGISESAIALFGVSKSLLLGNEVSEHFSTAAASYWLDANTFHNLVINRGEASYLDEGIANRFVFVPELKGKIWDAEINKALQERGLSKEMLP